VTGTVARVGFIGLGDQGGGMAHRLLDCGLPTTLWARRPTSLEPFAGTAATVAATPAELGSLSDVVGICVVDDAGVEEVVLDSNGVLAGMSPGSVLALHSTISLETCGRVGAAAEAVGVGVIDAPVSGGGAAAANGELTVLVGGPGELVEQVRPVFDTFANSVIYLGPLGSGLITKLVNNTLHAAHYALAHDALNAGAALGIDPAALGQALSVSSGNSFSLSTAVRMGGLEALAPFVGALLRKDVGIFDELVAKHGADSGMLVAVADEALGYFNHPRGHQPVETPSDLAPGDDESLSCGGNPYSD